ncbi:MAG: ABC transporter substrate-binding protein [Deltaproteobacteria bacterium]|nr:ABC transporter substrate-binding protein [Deltaproteobacteria bacterium]
MNTIMKRSYFILPMMLGIVVLAASFAQAKTPGTSTYIIGESPKADWGYPSPFTFYKRGPGYVRMMMIFDSLTWKDDRGVIPWLAESWMYNESALTYTFTLRKGVCWHDGKPFSAADVVFTYHYFKRYPHPWFNVKAIKEVAVLDQHRVLFKLSQPFAPFLDPVTCSIPIIPKHAWENIKYPNKYTDPEALIGTGPYTLKTYARERGFYEFTANTMFWGGSPMIKTLIFKKVGDPQMAALKGEVDQVRIKPEAISMLKAKHIAVLHTPHFWNAKLMINHKKPPMDAKEFRQALAHALDLDEIVKRGLRGRGEPASPALIPPDNLWFNPNIPKYPHNLTRVKELMSSLGYTQREGVWSKDSHALKLTVLTRKEFSRMAQIINHQFRKAGFAFEFQSLSPTTVDAKVTAWDFDLAISGHGGIGGDPMLYDSFVRAKYHNSARFHHPELDSLIEEQFKEMDSTRRKSIVNRMQALYAELLPAISLYYPTKYYAVSGRIPLFFTQGGIGKGVPLFQNKISFITAGMP